MKEKEANSQGKSVSTFFKKKIVKQVLAVISLLIVLGVIVYLGFKTLSVQGDGVATVNGDSISEEELKSKYATLPPQIVSVLDEDAFLEELINVRLLLQEARSNDISLREGEMEAAYQSLVEQAPSEEAFLQVLEQRGISKEELQIQLGDQLIINRLLNETLIASLTVSDQRIGEYYAANPQLFSAQGGQIQLRHILVASKDDAASILADLEGGAVFGEIAAAKSVDTGSGVNGGLLGFVNKGQMVVPFEEVAFALKEGELSGIVETQFGFHIIKRDLDVISLENARPLIRQTLLSEMVNGALQTYIAQLRSKAVIQYAASASTRIISLGSSFMELDSEVCAEGGKPIIRMYATTLCSKCVLGQQALEQALAEHDGSFVYASWLLDTGNNLATEKIETGVPKAELALFKENSPELQVPLYIFGCKYVRSGNAFETIGDEVEEFSSVLSRLVK